MILILIYCIFIQQISCQQLDWFYFKVIPEFPAFCQRIKDIFLKWRFHDDDDDDDDDDNNVPDDKIGFLASWV